MATPTPAPFTRLVTDVRLIASPRAVLWLAAVGLSAALLAILSIAIRNDPIPSQDQTVFDWVAGWDLPGLTGFFEGVSFLTNNWSAVGLGIAGIAFLWLLGLTRVALAFVVVSGIVGFIAFLGEFILAEVVGRSSPLPGVTGASFPSGHIFGSTVFFGMWGFLAVYYGLNRRLLVLVLALIAVVILSMGAARIYLQVHWPSDVAGGYLLGALWLLLVIPLFLYLRRTRWFSPVELKEDLAAHACESCRVERSIASVVVLNPEQGTATKVYRPPRLVKLLYWLAFQAKFPYTRNTEAIKAATYRRKIASLLTKHRFGKDLVANVTAVSSLHGDYSFVTKFVPGDKVENDEPAKRFLAQVTETFAEAGLSVWQVNPRNPHAHTNLIRTPEGDFKVIDLESAVVTLLPPRGQWRSSLRRGTIPVFDDIDFPRLRSYITASEAAFETSLGVEGLAELADAVNRCEQAIRAWKDAEPRIWGRLTSRVYRLLDLKGFLQHLMEALTDADRAADTFLRDGIARWEREGRLEGSKVASLRTQLSSGEVQNALHHMGAHLVLSVAIAVPIPGVRSLVRFAWTLAFWFKTQDRPFRRGASERTGKATNIHSPLVMVLTLLPMFGAVAYVAARPLRQRLLIRLIVDQMAWELPSGLYRRMRLGRWLAPSAQLKPEATSPPSSR